MTTLKNMRTSTLIKRAQECFNKSEKLDKRYEVAQWQGKQVEHIRALAVANSEKEYSYIQELAKREHGGEVIDYGTHISMQDIVNEEIEENEWEEGE